MKKNTKTVQIEETTKTIHLLPKVNVDYIDPTPEQIRAVMERYKLAASLDYVPDSLETLKSIDFEDLELLFTDNAKFFDAGIKFLSGIVADMISFAKEETKEMIANGENGATEIYERLNNATTADDLLNSGYLADNYEESRRHLANWLTDVYLSDWDWFVNEYQ